MRYFTSFVVFGACTCQPDLLALLVLALSLVAVQIVAERT